MLFLFSEFGYRRRNREEIIQIGVAKKSKVHFRVQNFNTTAFVADY